jgi:hypothetical protein
VCSQRRISTQSRRFERKTLAEGLRFIVGGAKTKRVLRSSLAAAVDVVHVHFVDIDVRFQIPPTRDRKCGQKNTVFKKFEDLRDARLDVDR